MKLNRQEVAPGSHQSTLSWRRLLFILAVVVALSITSMVYFNRGASASKHLTAFPTTATTVVTSGSDSFPSNSCASTNPISLLLPTSAIPGMAYQAPAFAGGGQPIFPMAQAAPGSSLTEVQSYSSAGVIYEDAYNTQVPSAAIESNDSFNEDDPTTVTSFSEAITGFTNLAAETAFFNFGESTGVPPQIVVNGSPENENLSTVNNVSMFPSPNLVTTTSLPGTDAMSTIEVGLKSGNTVIGMTFMGGDELNVESISGYVQQAIAAITSVCPSMDIMASSTSSSAK
jgi:hypothetical protein